MPCFRPCPSCDRHIRNDEGVCPFCLTATPEGFDVCKARGTTSANSRAAALFLGASVVTSAGCGDQAGPQTGAAGSTSSAAASTTGAGPSSAAASTTGTGPSLQHEPAYRAVPPYSPVPVRERDCNPPFTVDEKGKKTPKPYCQ